MNIHTRKFKVYISLAIVVALCAVALLCTRVLREMPIGSVDEIQNSSYQEQESWWQRSFHANPEKAYDEYIKTGRATSYDEAHALSHMIGEILYKEFGLGGIVRCTQDFAFGCYHGFAGSALTSRGISVAVDLRDACNSAGDAFVSFGCIHGIGHGILAYLGNNEISEALEACVPINNGEKIGGCYGGVFMEYNYNTMQSPTGITLREYSLSSAYEPCNTKVPEKFREACFYDQPSWWTASFGSNSISDVEKYRNVGVLCSRISNVTYREACFRGVGNVIGPESGLQSKRVEQWCAAMPDTSSKDSCLHEALQHLIQTPQGKEQLHALCISGEITYANVCDGI